MISLLPILLRIAGGGLILLALLHIPIGRKLRWSEDSRNLTPVNAAVFQVHTFFICLVLGLMGLPCLMEPAVFLTPTRAGTWVSWSFATFWPSGSTASGSFTRPASGRANDWRRSCTPGSP